MNLKVIRFSLLNVLSLTVLSLSCGLACASEFSPPASAQLRACPGNSVVSLNHAPIFEAPTALENFRDSCDARKQNIAGAANCPQSGVINWMSGLRFGFCSLAHRLARPQGEEGARQLLTKAQDQSLLPLEMEILLSRYQGSMPAANAGHLAWSAWCSLQKEIRQHHNLKAQLEQLIRDHNLPLQQRIEFFAYLGHLGGAQNSAHQEELRQLLLEAMDSALKNGSADSDFVAKMQNVLWRAHFILAPGLNRYVSLSHFTILDPQLPDESRRAIHVLSNLPLDSAEASRTLQRLWFNTDHVEAMNTSTLLDYINYFRASEDKITPALNRFFTQAAREKGRPYWSIKSLFTIISLHEMSKRTRLQVLTLAMDFFETSRKQNAEKFSARDQDRALSAIEEELRQFDLESPELAARIRKYDRVLNR